MDVLNKLIIILLVLIGFGFLAFAQPADSTIRNVVARIDTTEIDDIIKDLSGEKPVVVEGKEYIINNRHIKSPLNAVAAKYVYYKFMEYGYSPHFSSIPYPASGSNFDLETIYAIKIGKTKPEDIVVFAGSHDSKQGKGDKDTLGPGANENASGLSVVLEASRIFKNLETERTIIFVSFDDWANTGRGDYLLDSLIQIASGQLFAIGLDIIGYYGNKPAVISTLDTSISKNLLNSFLKVAKTLEYPYPIIGKKFYSPFFAFAEKGYEEVLFSRDFPPPPPYIGETDVFSNLDLPFLHANARLAIGTLAYVAGVLDYSLKVEDKPLDIDLYPNPASNFLNVTNYIGFEYSIINVLGERVANGIITNDILEVSQIPSGIYCINFKRNNEQIRKYFVKN